MITSKQLVLNGYKRFPTNDINHPLAVCGYQKRITDDTGTKYFINVYEYNFEDIANYPKSNKISYQFEEQFRLPNDENVKVTYLYNETRSLVDIEEWFESIWLKLNCSYYELD